MEGPMLEGRSTRSCDAILRSCYNRRSCCCSCCRCCCRGLPLPRTDAALSGCCNMGWGGGYPVYHQKLKWMMFNQQQHNLFLSPIHKWQKEQNSQCGGSWYLFGWWYLGFKKIGKHLDPDIIQRKYLFLNWSLYICLNPGRLSVPQAVYASEKARLRRSACN